VTILTGEKHTLRALRGLIALVFAAKEKKRCMLEERYGGN